MSTTERLVIMLGILVLAFIAVSEAFRAHYLGMMLDAAERDLERVRFDGRVLAWVRIAETMGAAPTGAAPDDASDVEMPA